MKVSVVITTYNQEAYIAQAVESVLMQEVDFDFELVVGEDCSTDRSREILLDYRKRYPDRVRLFLPEKNVGAKKNFTSTVAQSRGKYVAMLDGDDYWTHAGKLQRQVDFLEAYSHCTICFHAIRQVHPDGRQNLIRPPGRRKFYALEDLLVRDNFVPASATMFRRGLFGEFPSWYFTPDTVGDRMLHSLNAQHGPMGYVDEEMAVHRVHEGGIYSMLGAIQQQQVEINTCRVIRDKLAGPYGPQIDRFVSEKHLRMARACAENGDLDAARRNLREFLKARPYDGRLLSRHLAYVLLRLYLPWAVPVATSVVNKFRR